jgi:hypothetical protein
MLSRVGPGSRLKLPFEQAALIPARKMPVAAAALNSPCYS